MSLKCHYHTDREGTIKCEKIICVECKKSLSATHSSGESYYTTRYELCKPCYYDNEIDRYSRPSRSHRIAAGIISMLDLILIIVFLVIVLLVGFFYITFILILPIAFLTFLSLLVGIPFLRRRKRYPAKLAEVKTKKEDFFKTLQSGILCPECGNTVEPSISICPSCGYDIAS